MRSLPTNRGGKDSLKDRTGQKAAAAGSCGWDRAILLLRAGEESAEGATAVILPSASSPLTLRTWAFLSSSLRGPQKATPRPPPSPLPSGPRCAPPRRKRRAAPRGRSPEATALSASDLPASRAASAPPANQLTGKGAEPPISKPHTKQRPLHR